MRRGGRRTARRATIGRRPIAGSKAAKGDPRTVLAVAGSRAGVTS